MNKTDESNLQQSRISIVATGPNCKVANYRLWARSFYMEGVCRYALAASILLGDSFSPMFLDFDSLHKIKTAHVQVGSTKVVGNKDTWTEAQLYLRTYYSPLKLGHQGIRTIILGVLY